MKTVELVPDTGRIKIEDVSRFKSVGTLLDENGDIFFESYRGKQIPHSPGDIYHEVTSGEDGRIDLISYEYYATVRLWWVIADANDIKLPIRDVAAGMVLRIPPPEVIFSKFVE